MNGKPRIAFTYASVGSGHRLAAQTIERAVVALAPDSVTISIDALGFGPLRLDGDSATRAFTGITAPLYDALWGSELAGRVGSSVAGALSPALFSGFADALRSFAPDVVVATHALPAIVAVCDRAAGRLHARTIATVATDFDLHAFWPRNGVDIACVPTEDAAAELAARGSSADVAVTGIPVREQFVAPPDKAAARRLLGVLPDGLVVLALAGSGQPGPYARFRHALAAALPSIADRCQAVFVLAGSDSEYAEDTSRAAELSGTASVRVLGYTEDVAVLMSAADLAIMKPGGLAAAECAACSLPALLVGPAAGQERANADVLVTAGSAAYVPEPHELADRAGALLEDASALASMSEAACKLGRPDAAATIAELVLRAT
jgi:processive 1,2-diacylglycerol beta-glucosyltransferase